MAVVGTLCVRNSGDADQCSLRACGTTPNPRAALPRDGTALKRWKTTSPLLICGSWVWNTDIPPKPCCGYEEQRAVLSAAKRRCAGAIRPVLWRGGIGAAAGLQEGTVVMACATV